MKKIRNIQLTPLILLALGFATPALADTATAKTSVNSNDSKRIEIKTQIQNDRAELKTEVQTDRENLKNNVKDMREEVKDQIHDARGEFRKDVAKVRVTETTKLFTSTIARIQKIVTRVESRLQKLQTAGGSITEPQASVNLAKANLADAQVQVTALSAIDLSTTSTTTAATNFETIKALAKKAREDLESARQNLLKAVMSIMTLEKSLKITEETQTSATVSQ